MDDINFGTTLNSLCEEFAKFMGSEFEMRMIDELNSSLGCNQTISQWNNNLLREIHQGAFKKFHMNDTKLIDAPIGKSSKIDDDEPCPLVNKNMYIGIIGSILYLTASWLDIVFSTSNMC